MKHAACFCASLIRAFPYVTVTCMEAVEVQRRRIHYDVVTLHTGCLKHTALLRWVTLLSIHICSTRRLFGAEITLYIAGGSHFVANSCGNKER
jgi:hypothetical protein